MLFLKSSKIFTSAKIHEWLWTVPLNLVNNLEIWVSLSTYLQYIYSIDYLGLRLNINIGKFFWFSINLCSLAIVTLLSILPWYIMKKFHKLQNTSARVSLRVSRTKHALPAHSRIHHNISVIRHCLPALRKCLNLHGCTPLNTPSDRMFKFWIQSIDSK